MATIYLAQKGVCMISGELQCKLANARTLPPVVYALAVYANLTYLKAVQLVASKNECESYGEQRCDH